MGLPDPTELGTLFHHFDTYGECYSFELSHSAKEWLPYLIKTGWISEVHQDTYRATNQLLGDLGTVSSIALKRLVCFSVPHYRRYLLAVLAEGLISASQVEYYDQLEEWVFGPLTLVTPELNQLMDELEGDDGRMVEWSQLQIADRFSQFHRQHESYAVWDIPLLGLSGTPEQLFTAILRHADAFRSSDLLPSHSTKLLAMLPEFTVTKENAGNLSLPPKTSWAIQRRSVHSSLPFYDITGNALYDASHTSTVIWQDVLMEQPYYRAIVRTAIAARFSSYGAEKISLFVPNDLSNTRVQVSSRGAQSLGALLSGMVDAMGFQARTQPTSAQITNILEQWITVGVLELRNGILELQESYARTLHERRRAQRLLRGQAKEEQAQLEAYLMRSV